MFPATYSKVTGADEHRNMKFELSPTIWYIDGPATPHHLKPLNLPPNDLTPTSVELDSLHGNWKICKILLYH